MGLPKHSKTKPKKKSTKAIKNQSVSGKSGLQFPVSRVKRLIKDGRYAERISLTTPVFVAGILESIATDILVAAAHAAQDQKKTRIAPSHIQLAIQTDHDLASLFRKTTISQGGVKRPY